MVYKHVITLFSGELLTNKYISSKTEGTVIIDCVIEEDFTHQAEVTRYPVESGVDIADHVFQLPDVIELNGLISNFEFIPETGTETWTRAFDAYEALKRIKEEGQPVQLLTGMGLIDDLIITDFSIPRNKTTGADLHFTMRLEKIRTVQAMYVDGLTIKASQTTTKQADSMLDMGKTGGLVDEFQAMFEEWIAKGKELAAKFGITL